jgi:UDP:flavonoid glycosyltransferase YjiC (YdhE family)
MTRLGRSRSVSDKRIGHLNPMVNLGRELLDRGHTVTLFGMPDIRAKVTQSGLNFHEIGAAAFPLVQHGVNLSTINRGSAPLTPRILDGSWT